MDDLVLHCESKHTFMLFQVTSNRVSTQASLEGVLCCSCLLSAWQGSWVCNIKLFKQHYINWEYTNKKWWKTEKMQTVRWQESVWCLSVPVYSMGCKYRLMGVGQARQQTGVNLFISRQRKSPTALQTPLAPVTGRSVKNISLRYIYQAMCWIWWHSAVWSVAADIQKHFHWNFRFLTQIQIEDVCSPYW